MRRTPWQTVALLAVSALAVPLAGCIKVDARFSLRQDMSVTGKMLVGLDTRLAGQSGMAQQGTPFGDLQKGPMAERWKVREYQEDGWQYSEAVGTSKPGEAIFGDDPTVPKLQVRRTERRLTTRYELKLAVPPTPTEGLVPPAGAAGSEAPAGSAAKDGLPDMQALVASMMSGLQIKFGLQAPGRVVSTSGKAVGDGAAEWALGLSDLSGGKPKDMALETETPNWTNLGRLADQIMAQSEMYDAGTRLAVALRQDLLPNPPVGSAGETKLTATDYCRLLDIIRRLGEVLPAEDVAVVYKGLGLHEDSVSASRIAAVHGRAQAPDFASRITAARVKQVVDDLDH
jgi:hypothetical protein